MLSKYLSVQQQYNFILAFDPQGSYQHCCFSRVDVNTDWQSHTTTIESLP